MFGTLKPLMRRGVDSRVTEHLQGPVNHVVLMLR
jgi:hypothetical protein